MSSVRAFLAIPLPRQLQEAVRELQRNLGSKIQDVRWTRPESLHLTLFFFAGTTQENLEKVKVSVLSVKRCQRPFSVEVKGLGAFPNLHRPRVIWIGLEPMEHLRQLHGVCLRSLRAAGIATESRPYSPHLTIGRLRQQKPDLAALCKTMGQVPVGRLPIDRLVLFESRLHPEGAEHIPLLTVTLDDDSGNPDQTD